MLEFDVIIVGAGVAGMAVAHSLYRLAPGLRVAMVSLGAAGSAGATPWAQGGVAVAWGADDSPELHMHDTLSAGAGLCRPEAVEVLCREGVERIADLIALGACFDREPSGDLHLTREAAHSRRRVVHAGDASGREIARALAAGLPPLHFLQGRVTALVQHGSRVSGVQLGGETTLTASQVVLATGGLGQLFAATTNPAGAEGEALALAYQAGARLRDLEFVQFHPTALAVAARGASLPLLTEALRGEGARLVDETGQPFMHRYHPAAELAPRDVVAFALWQHQQEGHRTLLDARALDVAGRFGQVYELCRRAGLDPAQQLLPVTPAVHYHMGGIEVDLDGRSAVPGLWACGEVASTGVHGANRLASNSLLEGLVFGHRLGRALAGASYTEAPRRELPRRAQRRDPLALDRLRSLLWAGLGLARSAAGLQRAQQALERLAPRLLASGSQAGEVASLLLQAALFRQESRGAHRRLDHPQTSPSWAAHTVLSSGREARLDQLEAPAQIGIGSI